MLIPQEALNSAKCNLCNKFLSYFPIYTCENNQPICGRCSAILNDSNFQRATLFEQIAQYLKFPCIYHTEGCVENLFPDEVPNHEENCPYKIIACSQECMWQGSVNELLDHFEETHPNAILRDGEFEISFLNSYDTYSLLIYEDELFSLKRKFDINENVLKCSVFCYKMLDPVTKYNYKITVWNGTRTESVEFAPKSADTFLEENVTEISAECIRDRLQDPSVIIGTIQIFDEKKISNPKKKPNPEINFEMLSELECPVCLHYIIPPIFQCVTGHSICGTCKEQITQCPICREDIKNTQNFTLEKMAFLITYPCKNSDHGCDFADKPGKIKHHQKYCLYGPQHCPLKEYENCNWKGSAKDIYRHIQDVHHDNILEVDTVRLFLDGNYFEEEENTCYIMKYGDALFKLHYRYYRQRFYWAMQLIGPPEEANKYKFEIDICDNNNNNRKLFLRNFCSNLKEKNDCFTDADQYVFLALDQIRSFLSEMLTFRVRIVK
ncbi:uncharacterized protein LOC123007426 [Tribolium madens]|uniref:uncharacterized protein LOC123007426 n=1 Tax=Tribolium madens TaxID=41895 RepID=UPI001CF74420|nr:uncharacterized protein LOC123007426 [Tribolium madens]